MDEDTTPVHDTSAYHYADDLETMNGLTQRELVEEFCRFIRDSGMEGPWAEFVDRRIEKHQESEDS